MAQYSVNDILGKHLIAKKNLVAHWGYPENKELFTIPSGNDAGTAYSYVMRGSDLWWQFVHLDPLSGAERDYYILHVPGIFDEQELNNQNVKSDAEKQKEREAEQLKLDSPVEYYVKEYGVPVGVGIGILFLAKQLIQGE